jgi:hypothetical protein
MSCLLKSVHMPDDETTGGFFRPDGMSAKWSKIWTVRSGKDGMSLGFPDGAGSKDMRCWCVSRFTTKKRPPCTTIKTRTNVQGACQTYRLDDQPLFVFPHDVQCGRWEKYAGRDRVPGCLQAFDAPKVRREVEHAVLADRSEVPSGRRYAGYAKHQRDSCRLRRLGRLN